MFHKLVKVEFHGEIYDFNIIVLLVQILLVLGVG